MDHLITSNDLSKSDDLEVSIIILEIRGVFNIEIKTIKGNNHRTLLGKFKDKDIEYKIEEWLEENKILKFKKPVLNSISIKVSVHNKLNIINKVFYLKKVKKLTFGNSVLALKKHELTVVSSVRLIAILLYVIFDLLGQ